MAVENRIRALRERHQSLEAQIQQETARPHPDDSRIASLKRQKLRIKDEIQRMENALEPG